MWASLVVVFALAVGASADGKTELPFSKFVVFGDSYLDNGNVWTQLSNYTWPVEGYFQGSFSDGPIWADRLSQAFGLSDDASYDNWAYGGATTDNELVQGASGASSEIPVPGFVQQLAAYFDGQARPNDPDATLYHVSVGVNDLFFNPALPVADVTASFEAGLRALVTDHGARHVLVADAVTASLPYAATLDAPTQEFFQQSLAALAVAVAAMVETLRAELPEVTFATYGLHDAMDALYENGTSMITNRSQGCFLVLGPGADCSAYMFVDYFHPTTATHKVLAEQMVALVRDTWGLTPVAKWKLDLARWQVAMAAWEEAASSCAEGE